MEQVANVDALVLQQKSTKISSKVDNIPPGVSEMKPFYPPKRSNMLKTRNDSVT